tara:strand:- start:710 stop:994 length:285 start_codon:yes stop_codon:yes gene_type:complete
MSAMDCVGIAAPISPPTKEEGVGVPSLYTGCATVPEYRVVNTAPTPSPAKKSKVNPLRNESAESLFTVGQLLVVMLLKIARKIVAFNSLSGFKQ